MRRESDPALAFHLLVGLLAVFAGCSVQIVGTPAAITAEIPVVSKLPLRAGIVVTDEERDKRYRSTYQCVQRADAHTFNVDLALGQTLDSVVLQSFVQLFDSVKPLPAMPAAGSTEEVILVPQIRNARWECSGAAMRFALTGTLRVLDPMGAEVAIFTADSYESYPTGGLIFETPEKNRRLASLAISNLVKQWGGSVARSPHVQRYAARLHPELVTESAVAIQPQASSVTITVSYPRDAARISEETITVVGLVTAARGIQRLELTANGAPVPVSRDVRVQQTEARSFPFATQVPLRRGENVISVTAVDAMGVAAQAVRTVYREATGITLAAPVRTGERWAVVIGIDQYKDPAINPLRYATADAEAIFRFLTTSGGVKPANARLLINNQATQRNLRQVLGDFLRQKALKDDEVIIYYAGHGTTEPDQGAEGGLAKYLVPWDADPQSLFSTAIPMEEVDRIFGRLAARKILMVQDTCFSGGAGGRTFLAKGLTTRSTSLTDKFLQELAQKEGRMILTASDVNQVSQEDPALGHGIFTHFLLEALNGAADLDGDGAITVREVHLYLQRKVHERSAGVQTPQLYNIGDMVLVQKQR